MLPILINEEDRQPINVHLGIVYALAASLFIHILGMIYLQDNAVKTVQKNIKIPDRTIEITLKLKPPTNNTPKNDVGKPTAPTRTETTPTRTQQIISTPLERKTGNKKDTPKVRSKIHVSRDSIKQTLRELLIPDKFRSTDNGATVMDLSLLETLQRSKRIAEYTQASGQFPEDSSYEAGSWTNFVNISGMCFRVKKANPLEAMSRDIWYRTSCK